MKLTESLKAYLRKECAVADDAEDEEYKKAAAEAIATGKLSVEKLAELTADEAVKEVNQFEAKFNALTESVAKLAEMVQSKETAPEPAPKPEPEKKAETQVKAPQTWHDRVTSSISGDIDESKTSDVHVKGAWENYSTTKSTAAYPSHTAKGAPHPKAGQPIQWFSERGSPMQTSSDLDKAVSGAYCKFLCASAQRKSKTLGYHMLNDHDRELLHYGMEKMPWGGASDGGDYADIKNRPLSPSEQKALIDDAASGGIEAAPIVFDDDVIQTPLLNGELFPMVNIVPLERGRRIEGVATGTVTGSWGGIDDTAISLFNTASYVSAFDTTVYRWEGAIQIGLDFISDTPIDFAAHITAQYGERLREDLDDVIAAGNGTTQPEGIINKVGTTSVNFAGATSLGNYESLRFGVTKPEHQGGRGSSAVFCGTETSYQRARAIPVGAADARRIFGMDYDGYAIMQRPYKINESLTNAQIFYAIMSRYRMYQRRGLYMRSSTEGDTLIRQNELLMVAMARFGGQMERGACAAVTTTAPA